MKSYFNCGLHSVLLNIDPDVIDPDIPALPCIICGNPAKGSEEVEESDIPTYTVRKLYGGLVFVPFYSYDDEYQLTLARRQKTSQHTFEKGTKFKQVAFDGSSKHRRYESMDGRLLITTPDVFEAVEAPPLPGGEYDVDVRIIDVQPEENTATIEVTERWRPIEREEDDLPF